MSNNPSENIWDEFTKISKIGPSMESLNSYFFKKSSTKIIKFCFEWLAPNSSLVGDIWEVFSKFTKFRLTIVSKGGDKAFFGISPDHMIDKSRDSLGEIPLP